MTTAHLLEAQFAQRNDLLVAQACETMHAAYAKSWITHRDGNVSVRDARGDGFWISQSGVVKARLQPAQMLHVGAAQIAQGLTPAGASGEYGLHLRLQAMQRAGDGAVLHLHPTYIVAAMVAGFDLHELSEAFPEVTRYTRVGRNVAALPATSEELAVACAEAFDPQFGLTPHIVGLDRHGVVAIGRSPWDAFEHVERLEHVCQMVLASGVTTGVSVLARAAAAQAA
ncbi:putative AraD-like aldolase/epimerase [Thiomonas sp. X19]|uniref:class II aldolase/adducin family protein n=1 Tax=Thiomonas sp. X19 TaxID=1050370 RepID=UPI000B759C0D|nr:class II aldolase/adducin family protein [Thiomonas sp. X19]SCC91743.1 putative AraD-like aldolase/epimerase [Thiomonas sp. X19]